MSRYAADRAAQLPVRPQTFIGLALGGARALAWAGAAAVASAALSIAPYGVLYLVLVELLAQSPDVQRIRWLAAGMLALLLLRWALMALSHVLAHQGAFIVQHRLRLGVARRLGEVPLSFFAGRGSGSLRRTMTDDINNLEGFLAHMLPDAVASATVPVAALALLAVADWRLALATLLPLPFAVVAQSVLMRRAAGRMRQWGALQQRIADQMGEYLRGISVVKAFGRDARSFSDLKAQIHGAAAWVQSYAKDSALGWVLFTGLLSSSLVAVAPMGAWLLLGGRLDLPTFVLFLLIAPLVLLPLLRLTFAMGEQLQRADALGRVNEVLAEPALKDLRTRVPEGPLDVEFVAASHAYGERQSLHAVSLRAAAGELTALVGASGSGKSTLVRLLPRLYELNSGSVRVGGVDVRDWPLDALLDRIGMVFQEVFLFAGSVADNLRLARPDASDADLERAARAARAHDFIMALPQGYATAIGERGAMLSGGERQRLSIARALLKNAPLLLLDEATASVDAENEALIQQALNALARGRTVLMIAHRLRTVVHAQRIVVLDKGRVVGQGRHEELLVSCTAYQRLWRDHEETRNWSLGMGGGAPARELAP